MNTTTTIAIEQLNFEKMDGLIPAIIQDYQTRQVLMLGYMDKTALLETAQTKKITFYSRSRKRLWMKGETSGHTLELMTMTTDCDHDALLLLVKANGPCCHLNTTSCFNLSDNAQEHILHTLDAILTQRKQQQRPQSYSSQLFAEGIYRIAQKVGEEGVELALAGVSGNAEHIKNEAADLIFHLFILLKQCDVEFNDVLAELAQRHAQHQQLC